MPLLQQNSNFLLKEYKEGRTELKEQIFNQNTPLVRSLVNRYKHTNADKEDLFQIGCIGLLKAIENFDLSFNVQFSTYAVPLILGEIKKFFRDNGPIKVSRNIKELSISINKLKNEYYIKNGKEISLEEISKQLNVSKYDIIMALETTYQPTSLEEAIYQKDNSYITLEETIKEEDEKNIIDILTLKDSISSLNDKEKLFVNLRFYQDMNQQTIANKFNVSQVQISRFEKKIINKLKQSF